MGILRDNWRFHTLTSPLLFSTDERESVLIRVNIFSSSMIFFSLRSKISHLTAQTHWTLDGVDAELYHFVSLKREKDAMAIGNRFQRENIPRSCLVT